MAVIVLIQTKYYRFRHIQMTIDFQIVKVKSAEKEEYQDDLGLLVQGNDKKTSVWV